MSAFTKPLCYFEDVIVFYYSLFMVSSGQHWSQFPQKIISLNLSFNLEGVFFSQPASNISY